MKVGVVGCGALGSFYAARLARAGQDVHCLLRSDFDTVQREGFRIQSAEGDFTVRPAVARQPEDIGPCEVILIGLKTTANACFPALLPPLVGPETAVITLQNGLGNEEALATFLGPEGILGGLCFVCLNRIAPGVIVHTAHGRVVLGEFNRPSGPRTRHLAEAFRQAGLTCDVTDNLARAHWEKLVWNIPFNGLGVAGAAGYEAVAQGAVARPDRIGACLSTQDLLGDPRWEAVVRALMLEVIATANALGLGVERSWAEVQVARTRSMGAYLASTLIDFERGQPLELDSLFLHPLAMARQAGVETPWLERLGAVLTVLDPARR